MGTCLISHWPFNSQGSGRIFDQHKHGLWAPKGHNKRGRRERMRERDGKKERKVFQCLMYKNVVMLYLHKT